MDGMEKMTRVPEHVAIVMDGNGRWARERGLPRIRGHEEGANSVAAVVEASGEIGIRWLTLYAFSMENWQRPREETDALMGLLEKFLKSKTSEMAEKGIRLHAIGELERLPAECRKALDVALQKTSHNSKLHLVLALSYGSRQEIVHAARALAREAASGRLDPEAIDEAVFAAHLFTSGMPDPDLFIRTSGEMRLSNFLLWQLSYTEIVVSKKPWPEFRKEDLVAAVQEYACRERRFGGIQAVS